jgi:hypothetical protein
MEFPDHKNFPPSVKELASRPFSISSDFLFRMFKTRFLDRYGVLVGIEENFPTFGEALANVVARVNTNVHGASIHAGLTQYSFDVGTIRDFAASNLGTLVQQRPAHFPLAIVHGHEAHLQFQQQLLDPAATSVRIIHDVALTSLVLVAYTSARLELNDGVFTLSDRQNPNHQWRVPQAANAFIVLVLRD